MNSVIEWLLGPKPGRFSGVADWGVSFVAPYARNRAVWVGLVLLLAALAYLTIRSYRREGNVRTRTKVTLATIRIVVIALIIILILQPGFVISEKQTLHSYLVVLIDDSLSMSFSDRYPGQQVDALGKLLTPDPQAGPEGPDGIKGPGPAEPPVPAETGTPLDETSRKDIVRRLLSRRGSALARLAREHPMIIMRFSTANAGAKDESGDYTGQIGTTEIVPSGKEDDKSLFNPPPGLAEAMNGLTAKGTVTDIGQAVYDALARVQGQRLAGLVIISDGQITGQSKHETDRLKGARKLAAERDVALYTVCVGDPTPPKKLSVVSLRGPNRIRPGSGVEFTASVTHRGFAGQPVKVHLMRRPADRNTWTATGISETIALKHTTKKDGSQANRSTQTVALKIPPEDSEKLPLGRFVFKAVIDAQDDETDTDDNWAETPSPVLVTDKRVHVLLVSGDAGWEFQYLRNYLLRTPGMYKLSVWQQNADQQINQAASTGMKLERLPDSLGKLIGTGGDKPQPGYDLVILYDPKPGVEGFDEKFVKNLKAYVEVHGKGLCYIAGNKYTDHMLGKDEMARQMLKMLPVRISANTFSAVVRIENQRSEPWQVRLTRDGLRHQLARMGNSPEEIRGAWDVLPGMFWTHPVAKAKPAARVLLENTNPSRRTVGNEPEPVVATHSYGKGRVVYVGMDATWRWRCVDDAFYYRRFWGNMVEYLAISSARSMVISTGGSRFGTDKRITVEVDAYDPENDYKPLVAEKFVLRMDRVDGEGAPLEDIELKPTPGREGHFQATIDAPSPGTYDLMPAKTLAADDRADEHARAIKRITVHPPQAEHEHRQADPATMRSLASKDKNFLLIHQFDDLATLVSPPKYPPKVSRTPMTLWDCRLSLLLIVFLLTVEWIFRKKNNMA